MDGVELKIASMSVTEAEVFVKESGDLIERTKAGRCDERGMDAAAQ